MMTAEEKLAELTVTTVLARWPQTAAVFQRRNMACVGCAVADFYTISDAAGIYQVDLPAFLAELRAAIGPADAA